MGDDVGVSARPLGRTDLGTILEGYVISLNRTHQIFKNPLCIYMKEKERERERKRERERNIVRLCFSKFGKALSECQSANIFTFL